MANFELRIYGINNSIIDDFEINKTEELELNRTINITDKEFVQLAEARGYVATLCQFTSNGGLFDTDNSTYRAYLIDIDNENTEPVRVDYYNTIISASKVISHRTDYNPRTNETYETPIIQYIEPIHA